MTRATATFFDGLVDRYFNHLVVEKGLSDRTLESYARDLAHFVHYLEGQAVYEAAEVDTAMVLHYVISLQKRGLAPRSRARALVSIRGFFRFLVQEDILDHDPARLVDLPKIGMSLPGTLTKKEMERLLDAPDTTSHWGVRDRAMLELGYAAGLRVGELVSVKMQDISLAAGFVRVMGKGSKERVVPIGEVAVEWIREYLETSRPKLAKGKKGDHLFVAQGGRAPLSRAYLLNVIKKYALAAGLKKKVSPHTLRHSFATHLLEGGADLRIVQELFFFNDTATTEIYTHVDGERLKKIHRQYHPRS